MSEGQLTCQELVELVTDYVEGALPPAARARFEAHLRQCPGCANYLAQMRQTIQLTGTLRAEALDPKGRDELLGLFRHWRAAGAEGD